MTERACSSKKVMPRKSGVSNVRSSASRSNRAGGPGPPPATRMASQRIPGKLEQLFPPSQTPVRPESPTGWRGGPGRVIMAIRGPQRWLKIFRPGIVVASSSAGTGGGGAMALSMEEQRILAEIEQRLAKTEPALAAPLASFRRPRPGNLLPSPPVRVLASCVALVVVTVVSLIAYALLPLRALPDRGSGGRGTPAPSQPTLTRPDTRPPPPDRPPHTLTTGP